MSVRKNKSGNKAIELSGPITVARKFRTKTLGTRAGVLQDWRHGSTKQDKQASNRVSRFRDGR
jgi:hypothetical protein